MWKEWLASIGLLLVMVTLVILLVFGLFTAIKHENELKAKCRANDMVYVSPRGSKPYCAPGMR